MERSGESVWRGDQKKEGGRGGGGGRVLAGKREDEGPSKVEEMERSCGFGGMSRTRGVRGCEVRCR